MTSKMELPHGSRPAGDAAGAHFARAFPAHAGGTVTVCDEANLRSSTGRRRHSDLQLQRLDSLYKHLQG